MEQKITGEEKKDNLIQIKKLISDYLLSLVWVEFLRP